MKATFFMKSFCFCFIFLFLHHAFGQINDSDRSVPPGAQDIFTLQETSESLFDMPDLNPSLTQKENRNGIKIPSFLVEKKEKKNIMSTETDLLKRTMEIKPDYLRQYSDSGGKGNQSTQYLGEFSTTGSFVEIYCRDHEYVDGDQVQILVNDAVVSGRSTLSGNFQPVLITLEKGVNRIEFLALNEGTSSPNTAEFVVYDEFGNVIAHNRWNLARGVKASIVIRKP